MTTRTYVRDSNTTTAVSVTANVTSGQVVGNGAGIDNSTLKYMALEVTLAIPGGFAVAPTAGNTVTLYVARTSDTAGSGLSATPVIPSGFNSVDGMQFLGAMPLANSASAQTITRIFPVPYQTAFRVGAKNDSGQTMQGTAGNPITVTCRLVSEAAT